MAIYLSPTADAEAILDAITSAESQKRRADAYKAQQILNGLQRQFVDLELRRLYPDSYKYVRVGDINIPKKITERRSRAYSNKPSRKAANDTDTQHVDEIYKKFKFDAALKDFDFTFNYFRYGFVFMDFSFALPAIPTAQEANQMEIQFNLRNLPPYKFDMIFNPNNGKPWAFALCNKLDRGVGTRFSIWTYTNYFEYDCFGFGFANQSNPGVDLPGRRFEKRAEYENTLGRLPGAYVQHDTDIGFPPANSLGDRSIDWNVALTDVKTAIAVQGVGIPTFKVGPNVKIEGKVPLGLSKSLVLPQPPHSDQPPTEFEFKKPDPNIQQSLDVLRFELQMILEENGLRGKSIVAPTSVEQFSSGFDRLISEADVQYVINSNQELYAEVLEQEVFKTLKAYEAMFNSYTYASESLEVYFDKPKVLISDRETLENLAMRLKLGTLLPWEKHIILNPNLTEDEAKAREREIDSSGVKEEYGEKQNEPGMEGEGSPNRRPVTSQSDSNNGG